MMDNQFTLLQQLYFNKVSHSLHKLDLLNRSWRLKIKIIHNIDKKKNQPEIIKQVFQNRK